MQSDGDAEFTKAEYRYDALGRRTEKQVWRRHARKPERTQYAWSGLQMVGETSDSHPDAAVQYIYTENSYEPLARVDSHGEHADIFWYHTELNGLPDSVTDSNGGTVWRGASTAWGRSLRESTPVTWDTPQNLRFQGQYLDRETGLHYNTFRYYDPAGGCYTQMDPIGLLGGLNTYTYVVDPLGWVDPLGLLPVSPKTVLYSQDDINPIFDDGRNVNELKHRLINDPSYAMQIEPIRKVKMKDLPEEVQERLISQGAHKDSVFSLDNRRLYAAKEAGISKIPSRWATTEELAEIRLDRRFTTQDGGKTIKVRGCF